MKKDPHGQDTLNCDKDFLQKILSFAGQPGRSIEISQIRWKPFIPSIDLQGDKAA